MKILRDLLAVWRGRCQCYSDDGGPYGYDAHRCSQFCPQHPAECCAVDNYGSYNPHGLIPRPTLRNRNTP